MKLRQALKIVRAYNREARRAYESGDTPHYRHNIGQWAKASMYINRIRLHLSIMAHFDDGQPDRRATIGGMCNENLQRIMHDRGLKEKTIIKDINDETQVQH